MSIVKSENINELLTALAKAQGEIKGAVKDSNNPFFKSSYADLAAVWEAIREPLSKNNLSVLQTTGYDDKGQTILYTTLGHSSGQYVSSSYPVRPVKDDPQGMGSAISYARRYCLAAIVGVFQVDDDANIASGKHPQRQQPELGPVNDVPRKQTQPSSQEHEHIWLPSHFNKNEIWCTVCKAKKKVDVP